MQKPDKLPVTFAKNDVEIIARETLYSGFFSMELYRFRHRLFNGEMSGEIRREIFERGHAAVLLPFDPVRDEVVLVEQIRIAAYDVSESPWLLEMVAGMIEEGESVEDVARREALEEAGILRFCRKLNCEGYSEFRVRFKLYLEQNEPQQINFGASEIISFFKSVNNEEFDTLLDEAVEIILSSERIIFVGAGTSGSLAKYGARFFSNIGKFSNHIDDPYFPVTNDMAKNALAIVLSVSGETEEILRFASQFSLHHCKVLSITSHEHSRLAKLADFNLSWHVPQTRIAGVYDITTQIPVIYILESLGRKLAKKLTE